MECLFLEMLIVYTKDLTSLSIMFTYDYSVLKV